MNWKCKIGFHDWEYIYETYTTTFCSEKITKDYKSFRRCKRCEEYQTRECSLSGCYWFTISEEAAQVLKKKMYRENGKLIVNCKPKNVNPPGDE